MGTVGAACSVEMDAFLACPTARPYGSSPAVSDPLRTACSELPNDNPALHRGAMWYCAEVTGAATFERAQAGCPLPVPSAEEDGPNEGPIHEDPSLAAVETSTGPVAAMSEADQEGDDIEIVDELAFDDAIDESSAPPETPPRECAIAIEDMPSSADPFAMLVSVVEDVAHSAGADDIAMASLACLLGRTRLDASTPDATTHVLRAQALAWQGILRSESDDFGACGAAMLDEWCAALIAAVLGPTARADMLKRELRRRGVAAFGLVEQAA
jgi:hypothetical protein